MEENRDYHAYRYGDHLTPGSELKIEHSVVCENVDISTLITMGTDSLEAMRQGSIDGEQKAYEIVVAAAKQWEQQAAATQTINRALEYLRTPEIEHTGNQWKDTDNWRADQKISNRVYQMTCSIWEDTKYDRETKQSVPIAWYVTWEVRIHSPKQGYGAKIAGQNQKRYTDKNAAIKYLDGRKKAYSHLFTEISPPIPKEYEHHFMVHGTLLPGYTVEGLEQAKTEHAAAEVSEGGIFTPENQEKPSVLGKLSVAKTQEKTPTTPGTAMKKKEDGEEAKNLLQDLQSRNERMFLVTVLVENIAAKRQKLFNDIFAASGVAQKYNCALKRLDYQQEQGLMSSLALGTNQIEIERGLTTSSTAIFVPFTTCELFQEGEALYYGLNALSNNLIMANRKTLKNPNGLFLGTPGSGKSFSAKREIVNVFLLTEDDIIIADPENEYGPLVQQFGSQGQVIDISPTSTNYINPMDINLDYSDDENPITLKSDFILSLCDLIIGGKEGLSPIERTIIDRCTRLVYREYLQDPCPENMPILGDLYELLLKQSEPEAQNIATALEIYVNGSLNVFNHRSNIQMDKHRVLCFQLKSLGKALKEIGLLIMQDAVWNRVTANRSKHKTTWFYIDEFHLLLKGQTGSFSVEIWKRFRKWGGIPSGLTQNVKDLLASREIENIFENSDFIYMLNQAQGDRQILAKQLGISPHQLSYVTHSGPGEGLLFFGNVIIPFVDHFPKDTLLYSVLTTRPDEVAGTKA